MGALTGIRRGVWLLCCLAGSAQAEPAEGSRASAPAAAAAPGPAACGADRERAVVLSNEGDQHFKIDIDGALERYRQASKLYPLEHRLLWKLAAGYEKKEDWPNAALVLERATELAPDFATYWYRLGLARIRLAEAGGGAPGLYERAKEPLTRCIGKDPNLAECHYLLGEAYQFTDDDHAALVAYTQAIVRDPTRGVFYASLAALYLTLRLPRQAAQVLEQGTRAVEPSGRNWHAIYTLYMLQARTAHLLSDEEARLRAMEHAEQYSGNEGALAGFTLGSTYATMKPIKKDRAARLLQRFVKASCGENADSRFVVECGAAIELLQRMGKP